MDLNNILETAEDKYFDVCSKTLTALKHCLYFLDAGASLGLSF